MRGPPAVAEQWHCVPVSPASSGPAGRRGFSKQSGGPFSPFDLRRVTIFKTRTNFPAGVLAPTRGRSSPVGKLFGGIEHKGAPGGRVNKLRAVPHTRLQPA